MSDVEPTSSPDRRPINPSALEGHVARKKLKSAHILDSGDQPVTVPADEFVPVIRAEVGGHVAVTLYSYRVLVPIAQINRESATAFRRVVIASGADVNALRDMLIRHFGGVTMNV